MFQGSNVKVRCSDMRLHMFWAKYNMMPVSNS